MVKHLDIFESLQDRHACQARNPEILPQQGKTQQWTVPADTGRRYAQISADYNPIHLTDITARIVWF